MLLFLAKLWSKCDNTTGTSIQNNNGSDCMLLHGTKDFFLYSCNHLLPQLIDINMIFNFEAVIIIQHYPNSAKSNYLLKCVFFKQKESNAHKAKKMYLMLVQSEPSWLTILYYIDTLSHALICAYILSTVLQFLCKHYVTFKIVLTV